MACFAYEISADSYPQYRLDDSSLLNDGVINVKSQGRNANTNDDSKSFSSQSGFYTSLYVWGKSYSQKGGVKEDEARKWYGRASFSPEFGWQKKTDRLETLVLVSPIVTYAEKDDTRLNTYRLSDGEALVSSRLNFSQFRLRAEGGRGFQRLDKNGFLFANLANYGEIGWEYLPLNVRGSLLGAEFQSSIAYSNRDRTESPLRIQGGDLVWEPKLLLNSFRIFHYQYSEPKQSAQRADLFRQEEPFRPYGFFRYSGLEWESEPFWKAKIEGSAIRVEGRRENGTNPFYSQNTRQSSNAWLATLGATWKEESYSIFVRALYATKDPTFHTDQNSNGYASIKGDPRGYLAPFSILLLRDWNAKQDTVFSGVDSPRKPIYENSGLQYYQTGVSKEWGKGWSTTLGTGLGISYIGRGLELIAAGGWKSETGYLVAGAAYAWVRPGMDESVLLDEIRRPIPTREYFRWYASAGIRF
ncbi:hypothetical protein EHQ53_00560 [Leptospira langatensis]|uniref:Alginate export domain-containing protein n=1 Tax=Leptospira langatensis TaxID=2484983 RepID=A0A5F1ZZX9_9LEPT|nr:hypothetical protein EHO57_16705 [Leptospira langatensis]TGL43800.1 hypothetical protein EHQ53_00560 [Leptospira langatensis]